MAWDQAVLARLLARSAQGDRAAFKRLYEDTAPRVFGLLLKMIRERTAAEDVLQETYLRVWHRAGDYHADRGQVISWLVSIARYRALDLLRARRAGAEPPELELAAEQWPDGVLSTTAEAGALRRCLDTLSSDQRQSIAFAFFHGLSHGELARRLGTPLGTVKTWIRRGLARLKDCLER